MWFSLVLTGSSYLYLRRERVRVSRETCIKAGKQQKKKKRKSNIYVQRRIVCFHGADWNKIYFFERKSLPKVCDHLKVKAAFSSKPSQENKLQKLHYHYFPKKMHSLQSLEMQPKRTFFPRKNFQDYRETWKRRPSQY